MHFASLIMTNQCRRISKEKLHRMVYRRKTFSWSSLPRFNFTDLSRLECKRGTASSNSIRRELDKFPFFARWPTFFDFTISFPFFSLQSFHAELHQYKHHIELFNQLTQKLIAVYQQDDTTRVKKMTETINQRYNNLNTRWVIVISLFKKIFCNFFKHFL